MSEVACNLSDEVEGLPQTRGLATVQATDRLREMILDGRLRPGARISERYMHEAFGLSRTPLRESLKVLNAEGLVELAPNRGAMVTKLSLTDLQAAFELLATLDGTGGAYACERASDAEIAHIAHLHDEMVIQFRQRDLQRYFRLNKDIHLAIVDAAANPALSRVYRSECARVDRYRYSGNRDLERWERSIRQHEQMLDALRTRQGALLREILIAHRQSGWVLAKALYDAENVDGAEPMVRRPE
jgi:DNA-binding GntR family transcriptional regulator